MSYNVICHACGTVEGMNASEWIWRTGKAERRVRKLEGFLEGEVHCPCCEGTRECLEDCTFQTDCQNEWERMEVIRELLYPVSAVWKRHYAS